MLQRYDGITFDWLKQQLREGAVVTADIQKAYERFILGRELTPAESTPFKQYVYAKLRKLEKRGEVERCGYVQILSVSYQSWRVIL